MVVDRDENLIDDDDDLDREQAGKYSQHYNTGPKPSPVASFNQGSML